MPLKYEVIATGIPKPEALWYQDGKPIKSNDHFALSVDGVCLTKFMLYFETLLSLNILGSLQTRGEGIGP